MIRYLIGHFKIPNQIRFEVYRCLRIMGYCKIIFIFISLASTSVSDSCDAPVSSYYLRAFSIQNNFICSPKHSLYYCHNYQSFQSLLRSLRSVHYISLYNLFCHNKFLSFISLINNLKILW